jgi:hypothetical protein
MSWTRCAAWVGFDPDVVARLGPRQRRAIGVAALTALGPAVWAAAALGWAVGGVAQSWVLGLVAGAGMGALVQNLHRLVVAGGGIALAEPREVATTWRASLVAGGVVGLMGVATAQPLLAWLFDRPAAPALAAWEAGLVAQRAASLEAPTRALRETYAARRATLEAALADVVAADARQAEEGGSAVADEGRRWLAERRTALDRQLADLAARERALRRQEAEIPALVALYAAALEEQSFLVHRVQWCWRERFGASLLVTVALALRFTLFFLLRRHLRAPMHRYELVRQARGRRLVRADHLRTEAERRAWLTVHVPGWTPDPRWALSPFGEVSRIPWDAIPRVEAATVVRLLRERGDG